MAYWLLMISFTYLYCTFLYSYSYGIRMERHCGFIHEGYSRCFFLSSINLYAIAGLISHYQDHFGLVFGAASWSSAYVVPSFYCVFCRCFYCLVVSTLFDWVARNFDYSGLKGALITIFLWYFDTVNTSVNGSISISFLLKFLGNLFYFLLILYITSVTCFGCFFFVLAWSCRFKGKFRWWIQCFKFWRKIVIIVSLFVFLFWVLSSCSLRMLLGVFVFSSLGDHQHLGFF
ncbi:hypothetical protein KFK09_024180 [Dendrobium nobile]|uniref:Uncharacterized protein n=1 Tax=Dendrobium nobile TaxID=94219 RepID=A0A8T3AD46_DENNO|nr:hypothetical protein KFK09_024180 [Dendrobium nobile]